MPLAFLSGYHYRRFKRGDRFVQLYNNFRKILWSRRNKKTKPTFSHFKAILSIKYETEKYIHEKSNSMNFFTRKWKMFEEQNLSS